jgi:hypothetical protein
VVVRRLRYVVSDAVMAAVLAFAALWPHGAIGLLDGLAFGLMVEGGFLMMQGTLVDIATRLKKRPPVWLIVLIVAGVVLFSGEAMGVLRVAWNRGMVVFIPLLVSIAQRGSSLWHMPDKSREEKIAARALIANRITTALVLFGLLTAAMLIGTALPGYHDALTGPAMFLGAGALYFAIAAFDAWRVRGRKFAETPTVLFRFDPLHITYLDPL